MTAQSSLFGLPVFYLPFEFEAHVKQKLKKCHELGGIFGKHAAVVPFVHGFVAIKPKFMSPALQDCGDLAIGRKLVDALFEVAFCSSQLLRDHVQCRPATRQYEEVASTFSQKLPRFVENRRDLTWPCRMRRNGFDLGVGRDHPKFGNDTDALVGRPEVHCVCSRRGRYFAHKQHGKGAKRAPREGANLRTHPRPTRGAVYVPVPVALPKRQFWVVLDLVDQHLTQLMDHKILVLATMRASVRDLEDCHEDL